jgi:cell division protein FtsB
MGRLMTDQAKPEPATLISDEEIAAWEKGEIPGSGEDFSIRLIARIEAQTAELSALKAENRKMFTEAHHGNKIMPDDPIQPVTAHDFELIRGSFFVWCMRFVDGDLERGDALKERGYVPVLIEHVENQEQELAALRAQADADRGEIERLKALAQNAVGSRS